MCRAPIWNTFNTRSGAPPTESANVPCAHLEHFQHQIRRTADGVGQCNCAPSRIRTCDTRFRKPMLYPLSYEG